MGTIENITGGFPKENGRAMKNSNFICPFYPVHEPCNMHKTRQLLNQRTLPSSVSNGPSMHSFIFFKERTEINNLYIESIRKYFIYCNCN